jgi:hypothetical protein
MKKRQCILKDLLAICCFAAILGARKVGESQDKLYRSVTWQLLGMGQRHLAFMMAKARYR